MNRKPEQALLQASFVPSGQVEADTVQDANPFAQYLGLRRTDTAHVIRKVNEGLSYSAYAMLVREIDISQKELGDIVRIPGSTLARRQKTGQLTPEESDRVARVAKVYSDAVELFEGDKPGARQWLATPAKALDGATPLKYSQSELGAREVERLIGRLEHGVFS